MAEHDSDPFSTKSRQLLDDSIECLDAATQSRLRQARNTALERTDQRPSWSTWVPVGALASSVLMIGVYMYQLPSPLPLIYEDPYQQATAENMELLEDMELMAWLVMEESANNDIDTNF